MCMAVCVDVLRSVLYVCGGGMCFLVLRLVETPPRLWTQGERPGCREELYKILETSPLFNSVGSISSSNGLSLMPPGTFCHLT